MKIAITADVHLTNREKHPERFHALENILDQLVEQNINLLVIAGDLFDATCTTPGDFEQIVKKEKYSKIDHYIIPGNHDPALSEGTFSLKNIHYISKPQSIEFAGSIPFVFIPYMHGSSVGEVLAEEQFPVGPGSWVMVGHGDWLTGTVQKNQYEVGTYMPLSGRDLLLYKPKKVFLGHTHVPSDFAIVHYPGSPCGMDPTEIGIRSFLVFDANTCKFSRNIVETDFIYFNEQITVLPLEDEEGYIKNLLESRIKAWNITADIRSKVRLRVRVRGYSRDRSLLVQVIRDQLKDFQFTDSDQPDISGVKLSADLTQGNIAVLVKQRIDEMELYPKTDEPDKDEILLAALNTIYGGK
jgi:exonuclease SbcD